MRPGTIVVDQGQHASKAAASDALELAVPVRGWHPYFEIHRGLDYTGHATDCNRNLGPNTFDAVTALEQWVERDNKPAQIVASHRSNTGDVDRTRPLCPYPQVASFKGNGSVDEAASFVCK